MRNGTEVQAVGSCPRTRRKYMRLFRPRLYYYKRVGEVKKTVVCRCSFVLAIELSATDVLQ